MTIIGIFKMLNGKKILLIISGGIAAYKSLELIRLFKKSGANVKCVVTNGGAQFVTPLSVAALSEEDVYTCLLYTSPSPRDKRQSRMPSSA